jgi:threonine dehydrogenase-like Zn-dependent dehydrogenase
LKAVVYAGPGEVRVDDVSEPALLEPTDALIAVRRTAICASDLHVVHGKTPGMRAGGVLGHEYVGIVSAVGDEVQGHHEGTRVLGSFLIVCGHCESCRRRRFNLCSDRRALGLGTLTGDLDGAQAELVRVPDADVNLRTLDGVLSGLDDEQALFAGDVMAAGFHAAALAEASDNELLLVVGAGPVGLFSALAAGRAGARVLVADLDARRVEFAAGLGLEALIIDEDDPESTVTSATGGVLCDAAIEAVGAVPAFKSALRCVRDGGRVAVVGVYGKERYELPMGRVWVRGLDIRFSGMANVQAHWDDCLMAAAKEELDPAALVTHRMPLEEARRGYELFERREAMKVVLEV